ncbi:hypothetical protein ACPW96_02615 [Micromonospora sp. DT81.3]|uniref:hypothetical protein n=1 Tax=Micromonospora sp. DT81.3 TaxID=3416523 RepID=UPI003CE7D003
MDADEADGLAGWMNADGQVVGDSSAIPTPELLKDCYWGWSPLRIDQLITDLGPRGVLLGIAANQWDYLRRFDDLVLLELDADTQRERVSARHPLFQEQIRAGLPVFQARMIEHGALRISATRPTTAIAQAVIAHLRD